jgi:ribosome maturation factor RimP
MTMDVREVASKAGDIVEPVLANLGYELVETEFVQEEGRFVLRLYVDRENGITIDDCEHVSRAVDALIEVEGVVPCAYNLEVSSPGLQRPLRKKADFEKYAGKNVRIRTKEKIENRGNYKGVLVGLKGDDVVVKIDDEDYCVPIEQILKARIEPDEEVFAKGKKKKIN